MKVFLAIGVLGFVIVSAMLPLLVRVVRRTRLNEEVLRRGEKESPLTAEASRRSEQNARLEEEQRRSVEASRLAAEQEAQRGAQEDKACLHAEWQAHAAVELEAQRRAEEEASRRAEEARGAAEADALRKAQEELRRELEIRVAAEQEARRRVQEEARVEAEGESYRRAEEESRRGANEKASLHAEQRKESRVIEEVDALPTEGETRLKNKEQDEVPLAGPSPDLGGAAMTGGLVAPTILDSEVPALKAPRQYRPVARVPQARAVPSPRVSVKRDTRDRALPIGVRLVFERAGFCRVSLLPRRVPGMPNLCVSGSGDPPQLVMLQDEWYQDIVLQDAGRLLKEGIEWIGRPSKGERVRWSLSGREIYVLARHDDLNGFVNVPRMVIGEQHVVLCVAERLREVRSAIALTDSPEPMLFDSESGVPAGWIGLRGIAPRTPIAPSTDGEILDALRPLPEVEISLEGGIRIDRQSWLNGFPPRIRLRGDTGAIVSIMIDGREAALSHEGGYVVPGWDSVGEHRVGCTTSSRAYSIREGAIQWEPWDAYRWSLGEDAAQGVDSRPAICGVLVRPPRLAHTDGRAIVVPTSNPVLLGATPGEIEYCTPRGDMRAELCVGFPWFEPVWAIPRDALHCDKRSARILLVGPPRPVAVSTAQHTCRARGPGVREWCAAIRNAGRKRLQVEPLRSDVAELWKRYQQLAKRAWRNKR